MRNIQQSPDMSKLQDLRSVPPLDNYPLLIRDIYASPKHGISLDGSLLEPSKNNIEEIVSGENFFSNLWLTKAYSPNYWGEDESARFCFSFDLHGFFISRSLFSKLYQKPGLATKLLDGFKVKTGNTRMWVPQYDAAEGFEPLRFLDGVDARFDMLTGQVYESETYFARSRVLDIIMKKRHLDHESFTSANNLGTTTRQMINGPDTRHPETIVPPPTRVAVTIYNKATGIECDEVSQSQFASATDTEESVVFYEGLDPYYKDYETQAAGRYQYGCKIIALDPAVLLLRDEAIKFRSHEKQLKQIIDTLEHSPLPILESSPTPQEISEGVGLYNYNTFTTNTALGNITLNGDNYKTVFSESVENYINALVQYEIIHIPLVSGDNRYQNLRNALYSMILMDRVPLANLHKIKEMMGSFAYALEELISGDYSTISVEDNTRNKDVLTRRGYCQRKMPLLEVENYFDELYDYGTKTGEGYSYIKTKERNISVGLQRVHPVEYQERAAYEFIKYFKKKGAFAVYQEPTYHQSAVQFLTPAEIKTPRTVLNQIRYSSDPEGAAKYDLDEYGRLFSELIRLNYKTEYLNDPFPHLVDRGVAVDENRRLYNSLVDTLRHEHACTLYELPMPPLNPVPQRQYSAPAVDRNTIPDHSPNLGGLVGGGTIPSAADDDPGRYEGTTMTISGPDLFRSIAGSLSSHTLISSEWADQIARAPIDEWGDTLLPRGDLFDISPPAPVFPSDPPIKLTYSILGELELDPRIRQTRNFDNMWMPPYMKNDFNSFTNLGYRYNARRDNVKNLVEGRLAPFPNQLKSMIVVGCTNKLLDPPLGDNFVAARTELFDKDTLPEDEPLAAYQISYVDEQTGQTSPEFPVTLDPMKIYSKFAAFWLNYKQIGVIEYLEGFDTVSITSATGSHASEIPIEEVYSNRGRENEPELSPDLTLDPPPGFDLDVRGLGSLGQQMRVEGFSLIGTAGRSLYSNSGLGMMGEQLGNYSPSPIEVNTLQGSFEPIVPDGEYLPGLGEDPVLQENEVPRGDYCVGVSTLNGGHIHDYYIDQNGNGWTYYAEHPENPRIRHRHRIINYVVQRVASDCYPNCEEEYGDAGVGPHRHLLQNCLPEERAAELRPVTQCFGRKLKQPVWKPLTPDVIEDTKNDSKPPVRILCRVRTIVPEDLIERQATETPQEEEGSGNTGGEQQRRTSTPQLQGSAGLEPATSPLFDLPIYDQYFFLTRAEAKAMSKSMQSRDEWTW